jgi:hypothetical protein
MLQVPCAYAGVVGIAVNTLRKRSGTTSLTAVRMTATPFGLSGPYGTAEIFDGSRARTIVGRLTYSIDGCFDV